MGVVPVQTTGLIALYLFMFQPSRVHQQLKSGKFPPTPTPQKKLKEKKIIFATRILRNGVLVFFYTNIVRLHLYSNLHDVVFNILIQFPIAFQSLEAERQMQRYSTHT